MANMNYGRRMIDGKGARTTEPNVHSMSQLDVKRWLEFLQDLGNHEKMPGVGLIDRSETINVLMPKKP